MSLLAREVELVIRGARALGVDLGGEAGELLIRYVDLLYVWNAAAGLTTVPRSDAVRLHLLDALAVVPFLPSSGILADLGSGGGLPGVPVAVALPALTVFLVESRRKKCSFLCEVVRTLRLANCHVLERDARHLDEHRGRFDVVVGRAFVEPRELLEVAAPLVKPPGGRVVVMGARQDETLDGLGVGDARFVRTADHAFELSGGSERRRILVLEKQAGSQSR